MRLIHEDIGGCMAVVESCYLAHDEGKSINPASFFLRFPDRPNARIIGLPTHLAHHGRFQELSGLPVILITFVKDTRAPQPCCF